MPGAGLATPRQLARVSTLVIELKEGSSVHIVHIVADLRMLGVLVVSIDVNPKLTVV